MKDLTPKEKAKELVDLYYSLISGLPINFVSKIIALPNGDSYYEIAKQCELKAVDEIMTANGLHPDDTDYDYNRAELYWQELKAEIEKL